MGKRISSVNQKVMKALMAYDWPGNVRELENIIERAVILCRGHALAWGEWVPKNTQTTLSPDIETLEENERQHILRALDMTGWRVSGEKGATKLLNINASTLDSRMRKLGIRRS